MSAWVRTGYWQGDGERQRGREAERGRWMRASPATLRHGRHCNPLGTHTPQLHALRVLARSCRIRGPSGGSFAASRIWRRCGNLVTAQPHASGRKEGGGGSGLGDRLAHSCGRLALGTGEGP